MLVSKEGCIDLICVLSSEMQMVRRKSKHNPCQLADWQPNVLELELNVQLETSDTMLLRFSGCEDRYLRGKRK